MGRADCFLLFHVAISLIFKEEFYSKSVPLWLPNICTRDLLFDPILALYFTFSVALCHIYKMIGGFGHLTLVKMPCLQ